MNVATTSKDATSDATKSATIKSNPYLDLWLTVANTAAAHQRSALTSELGQKQAALVQEWMRLWTATWLVWLPGRRE
jgi:hypothetical protein